MEKKVLFIAFIAFLFLVDIVCQSTPTFQEYQQQFSKNYASDDEKNTRKGIYDARIAKFATFTGFTPKVNNLTDWTDEEISALKGLKLMKVSANSPQKPVKNSVDSYKLKTEYDPQFDWRALDVVTSVKNQGSCGADWAFSFAAYLESRLIHKKAYTIDTDLSEQYFLSCTQESDCTGGYLQKAVYAASLAGVPKEQQYPYSPSSVQNSDICEAKNALKDTIESPMWQYDANDERLIELLQKGPLAISISADNWEFYGQGVFSCPSTATTNHGVLLVGYTPEYWIIKNQWGQNWGESGYIKVTRSRTNEYTNCFIGKLAGYMEPLRDNSSNTNDGTWMRFGGLLMLLGLIMLTL